MIAKSGSCPRPGISSIQPYSIFRNLLGLLLKFFQTILQAEDLAMERFGSFMVTQERLNLPFEQVTRCVLLYAMLMPLSHVNQWTHYVQIFYCKIDKLYSHLATGVKGFQM